MSDDKPPEKPTVELPKVPEWAIELTKSVKSGISDIRSDMDDVKGNVEMLVGQGRAMAKWRGEMEEWRAEVNVAISRNSSRVRGVSANDLSQEAKLGEFIAWRNNVEADLGATKSLATTAVQMAEAIAKKTDAQSETIAAIESKTDEQTKMIATIHSTVVGTINNPKVRFVGKVLFGLAVLYSAAHGLKVVP